MTVDGASRRVAGTVELRLVDGSGAPPLEGRPLYTAAPGEGLDVVVHVRTEVPLDVLGFKLVSPLSALECAARVPLSRLASGPDQLSSATLETLGC